MDYRSNEDAYWRYRGYDADIARGLYNGCTSVMFSVQGSQPVTTAEILNWGKIDQNTDNALISALIDTATLMCEQYTNTSIRTRTIVADINNVNGGFILPYGPVTNTPSAIDWQNTALTLVWNFSQIQSPYGRMTVTYTAGVADQSLYKTAIMQQVLFLYENRGDLTSYNAEPSSRLSISPIAQLLLNPLIRQK